MMTCHACGADAVVQWRRRTPDKKSTEPVAACPDHALTPEAAAQVHEAECSGPGKDGACKCPPAPPEFLMSDEDTQPKKRKPPRW